MPSALVYKLYCLSLLGMPTSTGATVKLLTNIAHMVLGIIAELTNTTPAITAIYIAYQLVDFMIERNAEEIKEDIVEYTIGLVIGAIIKTLIFKN
jgi:hypothetical protein